MSHESPKAQFCLQCGAGIGEFKRDGEGTCPACDPSIQIGPSSSADLNAEPFNGGAIRGAMFAVTFEVAVVAAVLITLYVPAVLIVGACVGVAWVVTRVLTGWLKRI